MAPTQITDEAPERVQACRQLLFTLLDAIEAEGSGAAGQPV
jgi:hypothetical protein